MGSDQVSQTSVFPSGKNSSCRSGYEHYRVPEHSPSAQGWAQAASCPLAVMRTIPLPPVFVTSTLRPLHVLVSSGFWSVFALTLKTMVQPSGRALAPLAGCVGSGGGSLCRETQLRCPRLAWAGLLRRWATQGPAGACSVQRPVFLQFSTAGESEAGGGVRPVSSHPLTHYPVGELVRIRDSMTLPCSPALGALEGPLFL